MAKDQVQGTLEPEKEEMTGDPEPKVFTSIHPPCLDFLPLFHWLHRRGSFPSLSP